jgi:hypothetical protein
VRNTRRENGGREGIESDSFCFAACEALIQRQPSATVVALDVGRRAADRCDRPGVDGAAEAAAHGGAVDEDIAGACRAVFDIVQTINRQGTTIFMAEQNSNMALQVAGWAHVLQTGLLLLRAAAKLRESELIRRAYRDELQVQWWDNLADGRLQGMRVGLASVRPSLICERQ